MRSMALEDDYQAERPTSDEPDEGELALARAEAEVERLRGVVRHLESALRTAGRVLAPYYSRPRA
jgi:hypothetical protein